MVLIELTRAVLNSDSLLFTVVHLRFAIALANGNKRN